MNTRLRSDLWVQAFIRHFSAKHIPVYLIQRGHEAAGSIFIQVDKLDGTYNLYGPQPYGVDEIGTTIIDRTFSLICEGDSQLIKERLDKEISFDSDLFIIAVENSNGKPYLNV